MKLINSNFYFTTELGKKLFDEVASTLPIFDFHCHLNPQEIYEDKQFKNISEIWLYADHYKWRLMRFHGVDEKYVTGDGDDETKFLKYAETIEYAFANPLYYWSNLELYKYFKVENLLTSKTAKEIYEQANKYIQDTKMSPKKLLAESNVYLLCTTDNPYDDLKWHKKILEDKEFKTKVVPGFRLDDLFAIGESRFNDFVEKLAKKYKTKIKSYEELLSCLEDALVEFKDLGSTISDHGFNLLNIVDTSFKLANDAFNLNKANKPITPLQNAQFNTQVLLDLAYLYIRYNFIMQFHFGALRNNNSVMYEKLGRDSGFDTMNHQHDIAESINKLLDAIYSRYKNTPKMIFFNLDSTINKIVAATINNFQISTNINGKIQLGAAWWLNDTETGILDQLKCFAEQAVLGDFVGMLTDSRSFLSYARHDYFRRILCDFVGRLVEENKLPHNFQYLSKFIRKVCFENAYEFFTRKK